jgi:hypothetical protein
MSRTYHRHHRDDDILQDGERRRVPMVAMDAVQRQIAQRAHPDNLSDAECRAIDLTKQKLAADGEHQVTDGRGHGGLALRRPGPRVLAGDAAALDEVRAARLEYLDTLTNAWRGDQHRIVADEAGTQEGERANRRKRSQYRDPEGREAGTEEEEFEDRLRRQQSARRQATDTAYAEAEAGLRDAYKRN